MDRFAEQIAKWFGSAPFILVHILWFAGWVIAHFAANFDSEWNALTIIVSLEAIFLSLFILRAENVQAERFEEDVKKDIKTSKKILRKVKHK